MLPLFYLVKKLGGQGMRSKNPVIIRNSDRVLETPENQMTLHLDGDPT